MNHELNKWLESYGRFDTGAPLYRLVWSEDIFEHRKGVYREHVGDIFLREVVGVRLVRKYNYIHDRWIFEAYHPDGGSPEVPGTELAGDYVPVYVFESASGGPLPVTRKILEFLIGAINGRVDKDNMPSEEYLREKDARKVEESMDDHPSFFSTRPGPQRNAVGYGKEVKDMKERPN
jgi:hypothetical protein